MFKSTLSSLLTGLMVATAASPCGFHNYAPQPTLVDRLLGSDEIVLAHGSGDISFVDHADKPFRVSGILEPTGTPVDQCVHVSLAGIEAVHEGWDHNDHAD